MRPEFVDVLFGYTSAMALARTWLKNNLISEEEYVKLGEIVAKKYGVDSGSILTEISG